MNERPIEREKKYEEKGREKSRVKEIERRERGLRLKQADLSPFSEKEVKSGD